MTDEGDRDQAVGQEAYTTQWERGRDFRGIATRGGDRHTDMQRALWTGAKAAVQEAHPDQPA